MKVSAIRAGVGARLTNLLYALLITALGVRLCWVHEARPDLAGTGRRGDISTSAVRVPSRHFGGGWTPMRPFACRRVGAIA